jgi:hypothetical protein
VLVPKPGAVAGALDPAREVAVELRAPEGV